MCLYVCVCVLSVLSPSSSSSTVWVDSGDRQTIRCTLLIILRDQHWIKLASYFFHQTLCAHVCLCALVFKYSLMLSCKCIIPQTVFIRESFFLTLFSWWMWLMFISISWRSPSSCLSPLISLVHLFVLGWLFYFLSDIPVFPLDLWLFSMIHLLNQSAGRGVTVSKRERERHSTELSKSFLSV